MNDSTTTTTAPLTRRQAREIERRTGERPVATPSVTAPAVAAVDEQALAADVRERLRLASETARLQVADRLGQEEGEPLGTPTTLHDAPMTRTLEVVAAPADEVEADEDEADTVVPVAFTGEGRGRRTRRGRRVLGASVAVAASAAALAGAGVLAPGMVSADAGNANLLTAGGAQDQAVDPSAANIDTASGEAVAQAPADLVAAPESVFDPNTLQVSSFTAGQVDESAPPVAQPVFVSPIPGGGMNEGYGTRGGSHNGLDIVMPGGGTCGADLVAVAAGTVTFAGPQGSYGNHVELTLEDGTMVSYSHLEDGGIDVAVGQKLNAGDRIGSAGTTGRSTGCHLHFEVTVGGSFVDPLPWLNERGITV